MPESAGKFALGLISLVVLWIGVYWWWEPSEPPISFGVAPVAHAPAAGLPLPAGPGGSDPGPDATADPGGPGPRADAPRPVVAVVPPEFEEYTIRTGDTLRGISIRFFGTASHAPSIARANPLMDPTRLREGRTLRIPKDPGNIQGRPVPRVVAGAGEAQEPPGPRPERQRTHTVRDGDTLSAIAKDVYGTSTRADLIYNANKDRLKDRDNLKIGTVLIIPEATGRDR